MSLLDATRGGPAVAAGLLAGVLLLQMAMTVIPARVTAVLRVPRGVESALLAAAGLAVLAAILSRGLFVQRIPLAGQYEFALVLSGALVVVSLLAARTASRPFRVGGVALAFATLLYARGVPHVPLPTPPIQQNPLLLALHAGTGVAALCASSAAGVAALALAASVRRGQSAASPAIARAADAAALAAFLLLGIVLLFGSWWALETWGYYWSWDAKECAALAAWLLYAAYLHVRSRTAPGHGVATGLLVVAWLVLVLTYAGNLFFSGYHSYA